MADYYRKLYYRTAFLIDEGLRSKSADSTTKIEDTVNLIRCSVLRLLTYFSSAIVPDSSSAIATDAGIDFEWGFKFFCSSSCGNKLHERLPFKEFNLKNFEDFETALDSKLNRPFAGLGASLTGVSESQSNLFMSLQSALERLMHDFPRKRFDITSPVKAIRRQSSQRQSVKRGRHEEQRTEEHKFIFVVAKCPHGLNDVLALADCDNNPHSLLKSILHQRICHEFSEVRQLRLFWISVNDEASGDLSGLKLLGDALELIHGGLVLPGSILNLGNLESTHIHRLLKDETEISACVEDENELKLDKQKSLIHSAAPMFSFSCALHNCLKSVTHQKSFQVEMLDASICMGEDDDISVCKVLLQPLLFPVNLQSCSLKNKMNVENRGIDLRPSNSLSSSGAVLTESGASFKAVATFSGSILPLLPLQNEVTYVVTAAQDPDNAATELNFEDLLIHLALTGQILVICSSSSSTSSPSRFGFLRPLTSISATLVFFSSSEDDFRFRQLMDLLHHGKCEKVDSKKCSRDVDSQKKMGASEIIHRLPSVSSSAISIQNQSRSKYVSTISFNPVMMESWFIPECISESSDSLISAVNRDVSDQDTEMSMLSQLGQHYHDQSSSKIKSAFRSFQSENNSSLKMISNAACPDNTISKQLNSDMCSQLANELSMTGNSCDHNSVQIDDSSLLHGTPVKSNRRTPVKANCKTPRKTPKKAFQKTSRKTPRKTPRKLSRTPKKVSSETVSFKKFGGKMPTVENISSIAASSSRKEMGIRRHQSLRSGGVDRRQSTGGAVVTSRTALILQKSKEALERKKQSELEEKELVKAAGGVTTGNCTSQSLLAEQVTTTGWQELHSVDELLMHLRTMYNKVVEGEGSPLIGAKSIFTSTLQFFKNQCDETAMTSACSLLQENLCMTSYGVKEKYKGKNDNLALECKFREFQVQVCLQFEMTAEAGTNDRSEEQAEQLASMLSSVAIVKGGNFLSSYLNSLLEDYLSSSAKLLCGVFEHLGRAVPSQLQHLQSPDPDDDDHNSLPPLSTRRMPSVPSVSSIGSEINGNILSQRRSFYRHPTFNQLPVKQIQLNVEPTKLNSKMTEDNSISGHRRSARIASASAIGSQSTSDSLETKGVKRTLFNWRDMSDVSTCEMSSPSRSQTKSSKNCDDSCLVSPETLKTPKIKAYHVLKTKRVSETPVHKHGHNTVLHKMKRLRQQTDVAHTDVEVVEESPMKENAKTALNGGSASFSRQAFYPLANTVQSKSVSRYKRLEERMTQQITSPTSPEKLKPETTNSQMVSPRRITARVLFGLSPSPVKKLSIKSTPDFTSPCKNSDSRPNRINLHPIQSLDSLGVTFLDSPQKSSSDLFNLLDLTSPAKNTRLQKCTNGSLTVDNGSKIIKNQQFLSLVDGEAEKFLESSLISPAKNMRILKLAEKKTAQEQNTCSSASFTSPKKCKSTVCFRPDLKTSIEKRFDIEASRSFQAIKSSVSSPIKDTSSVCSSPEFISPAKNTRLQVKLNTGTSSHTKEFEIVSTPKKVVASDLINVTENIQKLTHSNAVSFSLSTPSKSKRLSFEQPDFTSPAKNTRLQLRQQNDLKLTPNGRSCDLELAVHNDTTVEQNAAVFNASPTFGSCKRHLSAHYSPVFESKFFGTNSFEQPVVLNDFNAHANKCLDQQNASETETVVAGKARKRLLMSPDCSRIKRKLLVSTDK